MRHERKCGDDRRPPIDAVAANDGNWKLRSRLDRRRGNELEQKRRVPENDLAPRALVEPNSPPGGHAMSGREIVDAARGSEPTAHAIDRIQEVRTVGELEQPKRGRRDRIRDDERVRLASS